MAVKVNRSHTVLMRYLSAYAPISPQEEMCAYTRAAPNKEQRLRKKLGAYNYSTLRT